LSRNVDTLFFMPRWVQYKFDKKCIGTRYAELLFLHPVGSVSHVVRFGAFGDRIIDTLFFKLRWDRYVFDKKRFRTRYVELYFFHPVGSVGHIVHSGASEARNVDTQFFMLGWDGTDSTKIVMGHVTLNFCFCIRWDLHVT
jgi:hypothetical protein